MFSWAITAAALCWGVNFGYQPRSEGGTEYIIQIEPEALDSLRAGQVIESELPGNLKDVRSYRIVVGRQALPHVAPTEASPLPPEPQRMKDASPAHASAAPPASPLLLPAAGQEKPATAEQTAFSVPTLPAAPAPDGSLQQGAEATRPWMTLTVTLLALFGSLGLNGYLGWIAWDVHRRYRSLLARWVESPRRGKEQVTPA